jgi:hypothetical protein
VHATAFHAARPRWSAAGAKSDPGDSYKLADYLRTDGHRLRRLQPLDAATRELQALVRVRSDHLAAKTAASNQLWALLGAHWPAARTIWFRLASPIALDFLTAYPTPRPPPASPSRRWRRSAASTPTAAARPPPSCSPDSTWPPPHRTDSTRSCWPGSSWPRSRCSV